MATARSMNILVLADGRWVRDAFAKTYETCAEVSLDETRGLGADFIQELFDHTVIIPELTPAQASEHIRHLTDSDVVENIDDSGPPSKASETRRTAAQRPSAGPTAQAARGIVEAAEAANLDNLKRSARQFPGVEANALTEAISEERSSEGYVLELTRPS
jgi:hypothetical protein